MASRSPVFRVETYEISATEFTGTTYRLYLRHELAANYVPMLCWGVASDGVAYALSDLFVRVSADPYGTGDLSLSEGNYLELTRGTANYPAKLQMVVVECLEDEDGAGFKLLDVQATSLAATASTGVQSTSDTSGTAWIDASRVVLFGGYRGGGLSSATASNTSGQVQTGGCRIYPSSTATLNINRFASGASNLAAAVCTTYVVQFGFEWLVQRNNVTGTNTGATLASTGHYSTGALGRSVVRLNSLTWACGYTDGVGPGDSFLGQVVTLGDGVTQLATETSVAVGGMATVTTRSYSVYTISHPSLSVEYDFRPTGDGSGASSLTVAAPGVAESYRTASGLYGVSSAGERGALVMASVTSTTTSDMSEVLVSARPTASTTITATPADTSPSLSWAGWNATFDFYGIDLPAGEERVFRVTTYQIPTGVFTGTTYDLGLLYDLSANYFVQIMGGVIGSTNQDADDAGVYVSQDPFGTGDLSASSGAKVIRLARAANSEAWVGTIKVWECLTSSATHGFTLIDVLSTTLPAISTDYQEVDDTTNAVWTDLDRVTLHTGLMGGGAAPTAGASTAQHNSLSVIAIPSGTSTIRFRRYPGTSLVAAQFCTYVVQWGSAWDVQRVSVRSNLSGSGVDATTEYATANLPRSVDQTKAMVFYNGLADTATCGKSGFAHAIMLGDGVTEGGSKIAVARWVASSLTDIYAFILSHEDLIHEADFITSSTSGSGTATITSPVAGEHVGTLAGVAYTAARRLVMPFFANASTSNTNQAVGLIQARPTAYTTATWSRDRTDSISAAGWLHTLDLGAITAPTSAIQVNNDFDQLDVPVGYLIMQDPHWEGGANVVSVTSEGGAVFGLVEAASTNRGLAYAYQEGAPTSTTDLTLRVQGGGVDWCGGYLYRLETETTDADWKGQNAWVIAHRSVPVTTADKLYAHALGYSTAYDRVLVAYLDSATQINLFYAASGASLASWSSTTIAVEDAAVSGTSRGIAMCETPDGKMLLLVQVRRNAIRDADIYESSDGGLTWSLALRNVGQRDPRGLGYTGVSDHVMASSGDYVRFISIDTLVAADISESAYQFGSQDRGRSWKSLETLTFYSWAASPDVFLGTMPFDLVGLGDLAGTFVLAQIKGTLDTDKVTIKITQGLDAWTTYSNLELDLSTYATSAVIKGLWFCRAPDNLFLYVWYEGDDGSDIACWRIDIAGVEDSANWVQLATITGFKGALYYGMYRPRAVWAGSRVVWSAGLIDLATAGAADPLVNGHWMLELGQWDPKPLSPSVQDGGSTFWYSSATDLISYQWFGALGDATTDPLTPYTKTEITGTVTWAVDGNTYTTGASTGIARHNITVTDGSTWGLGSSDDRGYVFAVRMQVTESRSTSAEDTGFRVMAPSAVGVPTTGYDVTVRSTPTNVVLYDNIAGSALVTISTTDMAAECEARLTISGSSVWLAWRKVSNSPLGAWTEYGSYTMSSGSITAQLFRVGVIGNPATAGTSTVIVREWSISGGSDLSQRGDLSRPNGLFGTLMTKEPVLVAGGAWVGWGGGGAPTGDTFTATVDATQGTALLSVDSPSYYWESTDLTENAIVIQADSNSGTGARWQIEAMALIGTVDRTCTLEFSDDNTWTAPATSVELDATLWDDLTVVAVDGSAIQLEAATGEVFAPYRGELLDSVYVRFTLAGTATGKTYAVRADQFSDDGWIVVDDGVDLATAGVTVGAKACLFADRMVFLAAVRHRYRYMRLVFPDVSSVAGSLGTATGTHRLGAIVPGHFLEFNRNTGPLQVEYTDTESPTTTTTRARSGVEHMIQDGPSVRSIGMLVTSADPDAPTGHRGEVGRMIRDLLRVAHEGYTRPVALVQDSTWRSRATVLYGVLNRDGTVLDQGVPYKGEDGSRRFFTAGELKLRLDEKA